MNIVIKGKSQSNLSEGLRATKAEHYGTFGLYFENTIYQQGFQDVDDMMQSFVSRIKPPETVIAVNDE